MTDMAETIDPSGMTVTDVKAWVTENPDQRDEVLAAEEAGRNRITLVEWLRAEEGEEGDESTYGEEPEPEPEPEPTEEPEEEPEPQAVGDKAPANVRAYDPWSPAVMAGQSGGNIGYTIVGTPDGGNSKLIHFSVAFVTGPVQYYFGDSEQATSDADGVVDHTYAAAGTYNVKVHILGTNEVVYIAQTVT